MLKTKRRLLQFDSLEGKVLLSTGMADPAMTLHRERAKRFLLDGALHGLPTGSPGPDGYSVTSFAVGGHVGSMGKVTGKFYLADTLIPIGKPPDLSNAWLILADQKGSVQLRIAASRTNHYRFTITSGTKSEASATGSGSVTISSGRGAINFIIRLHSSRS
jgi:hypothetical protein